MLGTGIAYVLNYLLAGAAIILVSVAFSEGRLTKPSQLNLRHQPTELERTP